MSRTILLLIFAFAVTDLYPVVIKLKEEAVICGLYVELGQIGEVINADEEIKNIKICKTPDKPIKLDSFFIRKVLENRLKKDFVIEGESVFIKPLNTMVLPQEIVEKIRSEALKVYEYLSPEFIQVILTSPLREIKLPQSDIQIKVYIPKTNTNKTKAARVEIVIEDNVYTSFIVTFNLNIKAKVIKAKRDMYKGEVLSKEMIKEEVSDLYFSQEGVPPLTPNSYVSFIGKKVVRNLKKGSFIYESCLK